MKAMMGAKLGDDGGGSGEEEFPGADMVRCADSPRLPWTPVCMHGSCLSSATAHCLSPYKQAPTCSASAQRQPHTLLRQGTSECMSNIPRFSAHWGSSAAHRYRRRWNTCARPRRIPPASAWQETSHTLHATCLETLLDLMNKRKCCSSTAQACHAMAKCGTAHSIACAMRCAG